MATKIALSALAATLIAGAAVPAIAGVSHRERQVGHHAQQHEHEVSVAGKRKGNKSKTLKRAFFSDGKIAIPALGSTSGSGPADPYPSTLAVAGFKKAKVTDVNLTLRALSHAFAPDVTVQLVAPGGRSAVVMGNVGTAAGSRAVSNITLTLDDEAIAVLPATDQLTNGSFRPRDNSGLPSLPAPAPALSGNQALATFDGINPNGQWQLFVFDKGGGDTGSLADGWTLEITAKSKVKNTGNGKKKR